MKNSILLVCICLSLTTCYSQSNDKKNTKLISKDYLNIIYSQCSKPDIIEVESNSDGYVEVEYLCDGKLYEIGIKNNSIIYTEQAISKTDIPLDKINRKLEKKYQGWALDEVTQIQKDDTTFLKVEIIKDGIEQNLYFTNDGKWFKIKPIDVTSTIDFTSIENKPLYTSSGYLFNKPDSIYEMPDLLKEISGIALINNKNVYCIQDEIGSVFEYNFEKQEISKSHRFTDIGDFEDVTINNSTIYILRSDGNLFVYDLKNKSKSYQSMLQVNSLNIEGICYNEGTIYIACKDALVNQNDNKRMIYQVKENKWDKIEPYLEINVEELQSFLIKNYPEIGTTNISFNPSSIAIHPITKELYILSALDRFVAIFKDKKLKNLIPLSPEIYYKPEGLSFYSNGDLLISSEGDKKGFIKGSINLIKYVD